MIINHNISALNANRMLKNVPSNTSKMASGQRITKAADDAAGLAVSGSMLKHVRGLNQAVRNINDGTSFIQVAEGYLQGSVDSLQRIRELALQAANGTYSDQDRLYLQVEVSQMLREIDRIASQAEFNGMVLLTGRFSHGNGRMIIHMGSNMDQRDFVYIGTMTASALGLRVEEEDQRIAVSNVDRANTTIGVVDTALLIIGKQRADLGAYQNRLQMTVKSQMITSENLLAAASQIRDLNMAEGSTEAARNSILGDVASAMLAQANMKARVAERLFA